MRALIQRINRKLRHNGEVLKVARGGRAESELNAGRYFIVNVRRNLLVNDHCDPEGVGREIGVMAGSRAVFFVFAILPAPRYHTQRENVQSGKGDERFKCANCYRMRVPALVRYRRQDLVRNIVPCLAPPPTLLHRPEVPS
jgi:hypothetical protein